MKGTNTSPRAEDHRPKLDRFGRHLHQQIVIPLMAAAVVVAVAATALGVAEMSNIIGKWIDESITQTIGNVGRRMDEVGKLQAAHASLLAQDDRLVHALHGPGGKPDVATAARFLAELQPALGHGDLMLVDKTGTVLANKGSLPVRIGGRQTIPDRFTHWADPRTQATALVPIEGRQTLTSFAQVDGTYTVGVADIVDAGMLHSAFRGLGAAFAYFDDGRRLVAQSIDPTALDRTSALELTKHINASDPMVVSAIRDGTFQDLTLEGERFRVVAQPIRFTDAGNPAASSGYVLAVVNTDVEEQAGIATMQLIGFWSILSVIVLSVFGLLVARRVSAPLLQLSEGARRVSDGDFSQKVAIGGSNEIADLANSFNLMTESMKQRTESITKKVLELATLYEMSRALGSTLELDVLLDSVLDSALRIFNVESGYIVLRDRDTEQLEIKVWRGMSGGRPDERALRSSMCEWVAREGRPLIYNPPTIGEPGGGHVDNVTGATAALCAPLVSNEGIIGAVTVGSRDPGFRFTSDDVRLLSTIANHATIAVGNIELFSTLQDAYIATVRALAAAVDAKDPYTRGHSDRVADFSMAIAEQLDLSTEQRTALEMAAYLHDIGKIGIREEILLKPGKLTDDEFTQMRHHPLIGANILKPVAFPWAIAPVVRHHHEHWDGKGYPAGLRGEEIPLLARILSVADSYEAMTSDRPYRRSRSAEEGIAELKRCAGTQFDPRVVDAFVKVLKEQERDREAMAAQAPEDIQPDEARAIFVAVCDGMLASFRKLGGPRLSSNLESECNRHFAAEELPFSFTGGKLVAKWNGRVDRDGELEDMRSVVSRVAGSMAHTSGSSLVDGFYTEALGGLSGRMRLLAETMELYRKP